MEHTLYFLPTDMDLPPETVDALLARVSPARRAKIAALRRAADARNALLAAVAVRLLAVEARGAENGQLQFACTDAGKPYLVGAPDFCFSLSHTDGAVALAVSPIAVGADIERLREAPRGVAARFFTPEEQAYCAASDAHFFEIWTRKEALAKRGAGAFWLSPEITLDEIVSLGAAAPAALGITVFGRPRVMTSEHCILQVANGCIHDCANCRLRARKLSLKNIDGKVMPVRTDIHGRSRLYDAYPIDLTPQEPQLPVQALCGRSPVIWKFSSSLTSFIRLPICSSACT